MAEQQYYNFVTDLGTAKITNAFLTGTKVNLTHFAAGDGGGSYYQPTPQMTALRREVWRGNVAAVEEDATHPGNIYIRAIVPSEIGGFTIREMGVFDDTGTLIAIANTADIQKVALASGMSTEIELTMHLVVDNTGALQITVDPSVIIATKKDIAKHNADPAAHPDKANVTDVAEQFAEIILQLTAKADAEDTAAHLADKVVHVTAAERAAWNGKASNKHYAATLTVAGWSATAPYTQTVAVEGITAVMNPLADVILSEVTATGIAELEAYGFISYFQTGDGTITAVCYEDKPKVDLIVQLKVVQ